MLKNNLTLRSVFEVNHTQRDLSADLKKVAQIIKQQKYKLKM